MPKTEREKIMLAEHILEIRHAAVGAFLDVRGFIADYIRNEGFFPHWTIETNVINFRDKPNEVKTEGAFVGYKNAGFVCFDPPTRNFFTDRASAFWKLLIKNNHYKIPEPPLRFGARTKIFIPSSLSFEEINNRLFEQFFTDKAKSLVGGKEKDLQFTIDLKEGIYDVRLDSGPLHKDEAEAHFSFESDHFKQCALFLDIDCSVTEKLSLGDVPDLLRKAVELTWEKADRFASGIGL